MSVSSDRIRVLIVESDALVLRFLRFHLMIEPDIEVVGEAWTAQEAIAKAQRLKPSLVTLPVILLGDNGIEVTRVVRTTLPSTKVLVVSTQADKRRIDAARDAGASGYVIKPVQPAELLDAIRAVAQESPFFVVGDAGLHTYGVLSPIGRTVRSFATIALLVGLVAGTMWGDDDHFPFGPFRMYSTTSDLDGDVRAVKLEGVDEAGTVFPVRFADIGLRRSEIEGQLPLFIDDPSRLRYVADAYDEFGPDDRRLTELRLLLGIHDLEDGRPVSYREQLLGTWRRS